MSFKTVLKEFQKRAKYPKRFSTRGSAFSKSKVIASRVEENLLKMGPPPEEPKDPQDTLIESYLNYKPYDDLIKGDGWYGILDGLSNGRSTQMNWYAQYQQMPPPADTVARIAEVMRNMPPLDPARIRQLARPSNFGTILRYAPLRITPAMTYRETFEREIDPLIAAAYTWRFLKLPNEGYDRFVQIVKSIVRAWASDVVTDTMRRYAQLDLAPSKECLQLTGEVAMDERTALLEIEDRKLECQDPDWTAANTRASLLELS